MMKKSALDEVTEHLIQLQNLLYEDKRYTQYRPYLWINCALAIIKDYGKLSEKMAAMYGKATQATEEEATDA